MKCEKCQCDLFKIQKNICCSDCLNNGAWDEFLKEYTTDEETIRLYDFTRDQVYDEGECNFGTAHGNGCYIFICRDCNTACLHLPLIDAC